MTRLAAQATGNQESPAVWRTLSVLVGLGPMRLGELAVQSRVSQPTMTKIVKNLVEEGWIERLADKADARAWQIGATSVGAAALNDWRTQLGDALTPIFRDLSAEDRRTLERSVEIMVDRLAVSG
ncbi:MarR family transcriptional regulator [Microbacteriaceae bacterium VKM Ac-2855]|nr:MarR family transcriptional regulator [Microbacteriaceae bacterium VKM Ac-2855]